MGWRPHRDNFVLPDKPPARVGKPKAQVSRPKVRAGKPVPVVRHTAAAPGDTAAAGMALRDKPAGWPLDRTIADN